MASSSSKRFTISNVRNQKARSFRTVVFPREKKIEICRKFRGYWITELESRPFGYLLHATGNMAMLELHVSGSDCYMTSGKLASILYDFKEPTEVIVEYEFNDNDHCFKLKDIKEKHVIDLTIDDEDVDNLPVDDTYILHEFENNRWFGWELEVSEAYASDSKQQVLHVSPRTTESVLRGMNIILIRTQHCLDQTVCTIKTYNRKDNSQKKEMYLTERWYDFKKANRLGVGDILQFQLSDPPDVMVVDIIHAKKGK